MMDQARTLEEIANEINRLERDRHDCWRRQDAGAGINGDLRAIEWRLEQLYADKRRHMTDLGPMGLSVGVLRQLRSDSMIRAAQHRQALAVMLERQGYDALIRHVFGNGHGAHT